MVLKRQMLALFVRVFFVGCTKWLSANISTCNGVDKYISSQSHHPHFEKLPETRLESISVLSFSHRSCVYLLLLPGAYSNKKCNVSKQTEQNKKTLSTQFRGSWNFFLFSKTRFLRKETTSCFLFLINIFMQWLKVRLLRLL